MASNITFTGLNYSGASTADDQLAARYIVRQENERRTAQNLVLAAQDPPGNPIPLLPMSTGAELKQSYLAILLQVVTNAHASYSQQAAQDQARLTQSQRDQLQAAINIKLDANVSAASILTAIQAAT